MSKMNGSDLLVYTGVSSSDGSGGTAIGHTSSCTIGIEAATIEVTDKGSGGWSEFLGGVKSWTVEAEGFVNYAATNGVNALFASLTNGDEVEVRFSIEPTPGPPESFPNNTKYFYGTAIVTSLSQEAPSEDAATFSVSFQGTGSLKEHLVTV